MPILAFYTTFEPPLSVILVLNAILAVFRPGTMKVIVKMPHMHLCFMLHSRMTHWTPKFVNCDFLREMGELSMISVCLNLNMENLVLNNNTL